LEEECCIVTAASFRSTVKRLQKVDKDFKTALKYSQKRGSRVEANELGQKKQEAGVNAFWQQMNGTEADRSTAVDASFFVDA